MNPTRDPLSETLHGWQVTPPPDPNFRQGVWKRISKQSGVTWPTYLRSHLAAWSMAAAVVVCAAGFTGGALAKSRARADREAIVVTYLVDLDPRVQALFKP
jgi:hypothetical protein